MKSEPLTSSFLFPPGQGPQRCGGGEEAPAERDWLGTHERARQGLCKALRCVFGVGRKAHPFWGPLCNIAPFFRLVGLVKISSSSFAWVFSSHHEKGGCLLKSLAAPQKEERELFTLLLCKLDFPPELKQVGYIYVVHCFLLRGENKSPISRAPLRFCVQCVRLSNPCQSHISEPAPSRSSQEDIMAPKQ